MASRASTPSEGEIVDSSSDKAKSRSPSISSSVNRQSRRPPVRYSRSPSPTAPDRYSRLGPKRAREDDHYDDTRRFRPHNESRRHDRHDRHERHDRHRRRSRDRHTRRRSRSPPRFRSNREERDGRAEERPRQGTMEQSVSNRSNAPSAAVVSRKSAETNENLEQQVSQVQTMIQDAPEPEPEPKPIDVEALREQKRKKWEAIRAKHRSQSSTPLLVQALDSPATPGPDFEPTTPKSASSRSPTPMDFSKDSELVNNHEEQEVRDDGPAAADYDPTMDMQEDRHRHDHRFQNGDALQSEQDGETAMETDNRPDVKPKVKNEFDMFADGDDDDDDDDMFAPEPVQKPRPGVSKKALDVNTIDDWDDEEGYYKVILGELLDGRYHVQSNLGKGMFSGVVRAQDQAKSKLVAIKLIRSNETMRKAAAKEIEILEKLKAADPEDKRHVVRLERSFEHKGHLCMVFENLHENLREVLKKFGRDVGIELQAVRIYAQQMFKGLGLLRKCNILHADLKPDNILVNDRRNWLKICDLGSASDSTEADITPYLVSRFYRAPEIILGMPYDFGIDTWSIGCTLYELYTGKILFAGRSNNQMLRAIMECRGRIPTRMLKRSEFAGFHFDDAGVFRSVEKDKITGKDVVRTYNFLKPSRDLKSRMSAKGLTEAEAKDLSLFIDFLDKCLILNPERRINPADALKHPFLTRGRI